MAQDQQGVRLSVQVETGGGDYVPAIAAGRSPLCLDITAEPASAVADGASFALRARELFSGHVLECELPTGPADGDGVYRLTLDPQTLPLTPGCWHLRVDLAGAQQPLDDASVGSGVVYVRQSGESIEHARASYTLAWAAFAYDEQYGVYFREYAQQLPPTGDPFAPGNTQRHREQFVTADWTTPELQHDGGLGFLLAAHAFAALGEADRQRYCETAARRTAEVILKHMLTPEGELAFIESAEAGRAHDKRRPRQQGAFALKLLAQMVFYFHDGPGGDKAYAEQLLERARPIYDFQTSLPIAPGVDGACMVYDGRILSGVCWYALAHRLLQGRYPDRAPQVIALAGHAMAQQLIGHQGWYDAGCLNENDCHIWYGNMNLINGLIPAARIVNSTAWGPIYGAQIVEGISRAWDFIVRTNGQITGRPAFVPTRTGKWAVGNMVEVCELYLRQWEAGAAGERQPTPTPGWQPVAGVAQLREAVTAGKGDQLIDMFHRNNTCGGLLMACPEFKRLEHRPRLAWDWTPPRRGG